MKTKTIFLSLLTALGAACGDDVSQTTVSLQFALPDGATEIGCDDLLAGEGARPQGQEGHREKKKRRKKSKG